MSATGIPAYKPIENYGVIGNLHSVALVGMDGSIDWCCLPHFDSPSVFGALLDAKTGGRFKISPTAATSHKQFYLPDSNILLTRFLSPDGTGEVMDFMPISDDPKNDASHHHLYRVVRVVRGQIKFRLACFPAFDYGRAPHTVSRRSGGYRFGSKALALSLFSPLPLKITRGGVAGEFVLKEGETRSFVLCHVEHARDDQCRAPLHQEQALRETLNYWRQWAGKIQYQGRWREEVTRSALVLKLLTFAPTGAMVASPTTSLPENIGGQRNWDYRYTWIRDASFTLYALLRLGFKDEATDFMTFLEARLKELNPDGSLNVMYGLHGEHDLTETFLPTWKGYQGSAPVRIGNAAHNQLQLDIYGELMDSVYLYNKYGSPVSCDLWTSLRRLLDYVCKHWTLKDKGIWEVRGDPQHFVYSKVMCWVALDRGLRLAQKRSFPADWSLWIRTRDQIYEDVLQNGWNPKLKAFVQSYGSQTMDASALIMPLVKFISPTDPRMLSTLKRIKETLVSDSLVRRYEPGKGPGENLTEPEGTFSMCTFWYAEALARAGDAEEARWIFEKMMGYANHLGLFSEEIGPGGQQLGNFPQAFTHLGLISAAWNIDKVLKPVRGGFSGE